MPAEGISFEEAVAWRKRQGFNSISFIAAFPNWAADQHGATFANKDGVFLRNAWEKFGHWAPNAKISTADGATTTAKDMHDEQGNRPFEVFADREGLANFDRINPAYFASLDRKMRHLSDEGFVPFLETMRRDNAPSWKRYFDFNARTRASCNTSSRATARTTWCSAAFISTGSRRTSASRPTSSTRR